MSKRLILPLAVGAGAALGSSLSAIRLAQKGILSPLEVAGQIALGWAIATLVAYAITRWLGGDRNA